MKKREQMLIRRIMIFMVIGVMFIAFAVIAIALTFFQEIGITVNLSISSPISILQQDSETSTCPSILYEDTWMYEEEKKAAEEEAKRVKAEERMLIHRIAQVIYVEARGESMTGKVAVGATVINRLNSDLFPDEIEKVLAEYAPSSWVTEEQLKEIPECMEAAERAVLGEDPFEEALGEPTAYFHSPQKTGECESSKRKGKTYVAEGNHYFYGISLFQAG